MSDATLVMLPHINTDDRKRIIDDIYRRAGVQQMKQVKFSREKMDQLHILTAQINPKKKGGV